MSSFRPEGSQEEAKEKSFQFHSFPSSVGNNALPASATPQSSQESSVFSINEGHSEVRTQPHETLALIANPAEAPSQTSSVAQQSIGNSQLCTSTQGDSEPPLAAEPAEASQEPREIEPPKADTCSWEQENTVNFTPVEVQQSTSMLSQESISKIEAGPVTLRDILQTIASQQDQPTAEQRNVQLSASTERIDESDESGSTPSDVGPETSVAEKPQDKSGEPGKEQTEVDFAVIENLTEGNNQTEEITAEERVDIEESLTEELSEASECPAEERKEAEEDQTEMCMEAEEDPIEEYKEAEESVAEENKYTGEILAEENKGTRENLAEYKNTEKILTEEQGPVESPTKDEEVKETLTEEYRKVQSIEADILDTKKNAVTDSSCSTEVISMGNDLAQAKASFHQLGTGATFEKNHMSSEVGAVLYSEDAQPDDVLKGKAEALLEATKDDAHVLDRHSQAEVHTSPDGSSSAPSYPVTEEIHPSVDAAESGDWRNLEEEHRKFDVNEGETSKLLHEDVQPETMRESILQLPDEDTPEETRLTAAALVVGESDQLISSPRVITSEVIPSPQREVVTTTPVHNASLATNPVSAPEVTATTADKVTPIQRTKRSSSNASQETPFTRVTRGVDIVLQPDDATVLQALRPKKTERKSPKPKTPVSTPVSQRKRKSPSSIAKEEAKSTKKAISPTKSSKKTSPRSTRVASPKPTKPKPNSKQGSAKKEEKTPVGKGKKSAQAKTSKTPTKQPAKRTPSPKEPPRKRLKK